MTCHNHKSHCFSNVFDLIKYMSLTTIQWEVKLGEFIITKSSKVNSGEGEDTKQRNRAFVKHAATGHAGLIL